VVSQLGTNLQRADSILIPKIAHRNLVQSGISWPSACASRLWIASQKKFRNTTYALSHLLSVLQRFVPWLLADACVLTDGCCAVAAAHKQLRVHCETVMNQDYTMHALLT
jgi:hypothetical protein